MWRENDVRGTPHEAVKHIRHPVLGPLTPGQCESEEKGPPSHWLYLEDVSNVVAQEPGAEGDSFRLGQPPGANELVG